MDNTQSLADDVEVTLSFADGRISGKSACNRYSAGITDGDNPGDILIGPTMGTRMACADHLMEIEFLFLKALGEVSSFSFHSEKLVLKGLDEDGTPFSLLFIPTGIGPKIEL
jgi:heat shock protein HslJ